MKNAGELAALCTPADIVQRLNGVVAKALQDPQFKAKFITSQSLELPSPAGGTPEQFAAFLRTERGIYENLVRVTGLKEE